MNIALWIVQVLLAFGFLYSGWMKALLPAKTKASWAWSNDVPAGLVAFIGWVELLGAVGVIVPQAVGLLPVLTPVAAAGLALVVALGAGFHIKRREYRDIGINIVFLALALFAAIGRF